MDNPVISKNKKIKKLLACHVISPCELMMWWESLRRWIVIRRTIPSRPCLSKKLESLEHVGYKSISQIFALSSHNKIYCSCFRFLIVAVVVVEAAWWGLTESLGHRVSERVFIIIIIFCFHFSSVKVWRINGSWRGQ